MRKKFTAKDGSEFILREPKLNDAKGLMKMINQMVRERNIPIGADHMYTLKQEREWLSGVIKGIKKKEKVMLVVEADGKICGNCSIERREGKCNHRGYIGITVSKELRSKGIGTVLMRETIKLAQKRMKGLKIIELDVYANNKIAIGLYKKLGFKRFGKHPDFAREGRKYVDAYLMQLYLK